MSHYQPKKSKIYHIHEQNTHLLAWNDSDKSKNSKATRPSTEPIAYPTVNIISSQRKGLCICFTKDIDETHQQCQQEPPQEHSMAIPI